MCEPMNYDFKLLSTISINVKPYVNQPIKRQVCKIVLFRIEIEKNALRVRIAVVLGSKLSV